MRSEPRLPRAASPARTSPERRAASKPSEADVPEVGEASAVPGVETASDERRERFRRRLVRSARKQARTLAAGVKNGRAFEELERLRRTAFSEPDGKDASARVEAARALIRLVGDPQLIVQSRDFARSVGLENAVALDAAARSILQRKRLSAEEKALLETLESEGPAELDASLPPVSRVTRKLLLEPAKQRFRQLPDESGLRLRKDGDPRLRAEVRRRGAGARDFRLPEYVRVRPPEEIESPAEGALEKRFAEVDRARVSGPRPLSPAEAALLHRGRTAPSRTLAQAGPRSAARRRFREADALIDRWVRRGEDLDLDKLQALSRTVLEGGRESADAGRLRDYDNGLWMPGQFVSFAPWETIPAYLEDFMTWYAANEGRMHPVRLAALAYQQFVRIHPFVNGNGRAGRLVMDFILQRNGYLPPVFTAVDARTITDNPAVLIDRVSQGILNSEALLRSSSGR